MTCSREQRERPPSGRGLSLALSLSLARSLSLALALAPSLALSLALSLSLARSEPATCSQARWRHPPTAASRRSISAGWAPACPGVEVLGVEQLLGRNVKQFRGGLVSKAHSFVYHSNLGLRVIKKKKKKGATTFTRRFHAALRLRRRGTIGLPRS